MNPAIHEISPAAQAASRAAPADVLRASVLTCVLDEIDHGLLLVDLNGRIVHANHPARRELAAARALCSQDGVLGAGQPVWQARIRQALKDAERGCRSIVELEHGSEPLTLAFIPLEPREAGTATDTVLIMCNRAAGCETLTMQMFARAKQLTRAEQNVLAQLCAGHGAEEIAGQQGIRLSTVRTHIKNVRQKTGSSSIREVVHRVSRMPQIVSALRMS